VILGPDGTPFVHSLFFFDIQLPSDYPTSPPVVHFRCPVEERCGGFGVVCPCR
jgi:ubiquitin-protein ligase